MVLFVMLGLRQGEDDASRAAQEIRKRRWPVWREEKGPPDHWAAEAHGREEKQRFGFHPMDRSSLSHLWWKGALSCNVTNPTVGWQLLFWRSCLLVLARPKRSVSRRDASVAEACVLDFIYRMVEGICGLKKVKYFPDIMTLFSFRILELLALAAVGVRLRRINLCHAE